MKRHTARTIACVVLLVLLCPGAAFVRLNAKQQIAERREVAARIASVLAAAIDREFDAVIRNLRAVARTLPDRGSDAGIVPVAADILEHNLIVQHVVRIEGPATINVYPADSDAFVRALQILLPASVGTPTADLAAVDESTLVESVRYAGVENILIGVSVPGAAGSPIGTPGTRIAASIPIERLLRAAGFDRLADSGFDYQLTDNNPRSGERRILARSREAELSDPIAQTIARGNARWRAVLAPRAGWLEWSSVWIQGLLAALFALIAALSTYELACSVERRQRDVDRYRDRLRIAQRRLGEEIERREEFGRRFDHADSHDAFTGLPNRQHFIERLERWLRGARKESGRTAAVTVFDFDRWKSINDTLGHNAGDQILIQAVRRLEACLGADTVIARVGSSELAALMFEVPDSIAAVAVAERLLTALSEPFDIGGQRVFATPSAGIAMCASGYDRADTLLRDADIALSKAHSQERTRLAMFDVAERDHVVTSLQLETDLHRAVRDEEFRLVYQPIVSLTAGHIAGMEALLRWEHPVEGMIAPDRFIRVAEETGLILPITRWVLRTACEQARVWRTQLPNDVDFYLSVNLSALDMRQPDLADYVGDLLSTNKLPRGMLRFEITEGSMINNIRVASDLVTRLRALGSPLLLDDFGTGYSSLGYLQRFQFDYLKIDRSFVSRIDPHGGNAGIVRAIIHMANDLGLQTIAEGIETMETMQHLRALGCKYGQGYLYSRPLPVEAMTSLLESRPRWPFASSPPQPEAGESRLATMEPEG